MESALESTDDESDCIVCHDPCKTISVCCKQSLCNDCTLKWWEYKRQCPHCRRDMIDFSLWVEKYKNSSKSLVGSGDTFIGGNNNIIIGYDNPGAITTGNNGTFVGQNAGAHITTGSDGIFIGWEGAPSYSVVNGGTTASTFDESRTLNAGHNGTIAPPMNFIIGGGYNNTIIVTGGNNTFIGPTNNTINITGGNNTFIGGGNQATGSEDSSNSSDDYIAISAGYNGTGIGDNSETSSAVNAISTQEEMNPSRSRLPVDRLVDNIIEPSGWV